MPTYNVRQGEYMDGSGGKMFPYPLRMKAKNLDDLRKQLYVDSVDKITYVYDIETPSGVRYVMTVPSKSRNYKGATWIDPKGNIRAIDPKTGRLVRRD